MNMRTLCHGWMVFTICLFNSQSLQAQTISDDTTVNDLETVDGLCGINDRPIRLAEMKWDSNLFHNALVSFILREGYDCLVETTTGSNIALIEKLASGEIDIMMEVWKDNLDQVWERAEKNRRIKILGANYNDAQQGWYIPRYLVEGDEVLGLQPLAPELKRVSELAQYKQLFSDPLNPEQGRFYNCQQGWGCEVINTRKLKAYGLEEHFNNFRPASQTALAAAISRHYEQGDAFVTYYWGPTWVLGKYDLLKLEESPYNEQVWGAMLADEEPTQAVAYPQLQVDIAVSINFFSKAQEISNFLTAYQTDNAIISKALAYQRDVIDRTPTDAAVYFLRTQGERWVDWTSPEVADKIKQAVAIDLDTSR